MSGRRWGYCCNDLGRLDMTKTDKDASGTPRRAHHTQPGEPYHLDPECQNLKKTENHTRTTSVDEAELWKRPCSLCVEGKDISNKGKSITPTADLIRQSDQDLELE